LPLREGHLMTVLWLKDRLVGYANHATHQYLLWEEGLSAVTGRKPNTSRHAGILLLLAFGLLFISWAEVDMVPNSHATRNSWAMIVCFSFIAIILIPVLACFGGLYRRLMYAHCRRVFTKLIEEELKSTLSKSPDLG
jgi:hypothetical protein